MEPNRRREIFVLSIAGDSYSEIGERVGMSVPAVEAVLLEIIVEAHSLIAERVGACSPEEWIDLFLRCGLFES